MRKERWERLSNKEQEVFAPVCPDFVVELRSPQDRIETLQAKMSEYLNDLVSGAQLGWLVDPIEKRLYVYRAREPTQCLEDPKSGTMLRGFVLDLSELW